MRDALRRKERWGKGRRAPTQDPGTDLAGCSRELRSRWVLLFGPNTWLTRSSTVPAWLALGTAQRSSASLTHVAFTRSLPKWQRK